MPPRSRYVTCVNKLDMQPSGCMSCCADAIWSSQNRLSGVPFREHKSLRGNDLRRSDRCLQVGDIGVAVAD